MICKKCRQHRNIRSFYKTNKSTCKKCLILQGSAYHKIWRKENPDKVRTIEQRYRARHRTQLSNYYKEWYYTKGRGRHKASENLPIDNSQNFM